MSGQRNAYPPDVLSDRYELGEMLGYGGMSEVRRGRDLHLDRQVAVKTLRADLAEDTRLLGRFRREARHSAALNHPAIVAVYDTGETGSVYGPLPYIVMEYVDGRTLRDIVKADGPMNARRAMEVIADVCAALGYAHRHGLIHRDVKPANVMISASGAVKVMDFGIAHAIHDSQSITTQASMVLGTAQYLSPEQARGEPVDPRSDVYAAGCLLYELITGGPPFTGDSHIAISHQHVHEDPQPPSAVNPAVGPRLDAVVMKALTKGPVNRYQSAEEMRSDLGRVLASRRPLAPRVLTDEDRAQLMNASTAAKRPASKRDAATATTTATRSGNRAPAALALAAIAAILLALWQFGPSDGEPVQAIPRIVGQPFEAGEGVLREAGFTDIQQRSVPCWPRAYGQRPKCGQDQYGKVIKTDPSHGIRVTINTPIVVHVGKAPGRFAMPTVVDKSRADALRVLKKRHLLLHPEVEEVRNTDPARTGTVASQDPLEGVAVSQGDVVRLAVYQQPKMVTVTDYIGKSQEFARAGLEGAGFTVAVDVVSSERKKGMVVGQHPRNGQAVKGSTVTLRVSDGAEDAMVMPELSGMSEQDARTTLDNHGHGGRVLVERIEVDDPDTDGRVVETDPRPHAAMRTSDTVTIYLGEYTEPSPTSSVPATSAAPTAPPWPTAPTPTSENPNRVD